MRSVYRTLAALSAIGLGLSLCIHGAAWFHQELLPGDWAFVLHVLLFVVFGPMVYFANKTKPTPQTRNNTDHLLGCLPRWARLLLSATFVYALAQFALFMWQASHYPKSHVPHDLIVRGFSGHWIIFYSASLAGYVGLLRYQPKLGSVFAAAGPS